MSDEMLTRLNRGLVILAQIIDVNCVTGNLAFHCTDEDAIQLNKCLVRLLTMKYFVQHWNSFLKESVANGNWKSDSLHVRKALQELEMFFVLRGCS